MLSTESFTGARALGEESLQMWDLNKRLEAYLARVKFLEEENEVLRAEIQSAQSSPGGDSWRARSEAELRALREALGRAYREKCTAELARDNLYEEVEQVKSRCQKEQAAREEAKKQLALCRKELEEERRAQIWLKERAVQLGKEVEALLEVHEEEKAGLDQELATFSQSLESFRCAPVAFQPVEVEDYSKRLSEIWKGAVETYKTEVWQLEGSLCQAKENLWKAVEDNQQSQLQLRHLEKELAGLKARKEMLEENLARQWQEQRGEAEKFQLALEALEQEKQTLRVQIAQVLEDRQQLMHLKMSLSLEVATYRTLLEAESTRLQLPAGEYKLANGLRDLKLEASGSSKLAPAGTEPRRLLPRDHRASPSLFPRVEGRGQPAKAQSDALTPKSRSPGSRELQKLSSVLHAAAPQAAGTARAPSAPRCPTPSPSQPARAAPPLSPEPPSPASPEPGSPGGEGPAWPGGDEGEESQGKENPPPGTLAETQAADAEPLGPVPTRSLRYPAQLVSEALEDALKEMKDDAQPKEEPELSPTWAPRDAPSPLPPTEAATEGAEEGADPSEGAGGGEAPEAEERAEEGAVQELGSHPCGSAATLSREGMGAWGEEVPRAPSPGEPEVVAQEQERSGPGQMGSSWEEPEPGEDEVEAPGVEASHPEEEEEEEEEEEGGPFSPCPEGDGDSQGQGTDVEEGESPQGEGEGAAALPVESHPAVPRESDLEEDLADGEQEPERREVLVCELDGAAEEGSGRERSPEQELYPQQEPSSIHGATPAEKAPEGAEGDAGGAEEPSREEDGEGEKGEAGGEGLGGEDPWAGEAAGPETPELERTLGQERTLEQERTQEQPGELQENSLGGEQWEQEPELGEEPWAGRDDGNDQNPHPEDWEVTAEDTEEPAWAEDTPAGAGGLGSQETDGTLPAGLEGTQEDDEEDAESQGLSQQQPPPPPGTEPAPELAWAEQEGTAGQPARAPPDVPGRGHSPEPAEEPWEGQEEDAEDEPGGSSAGPAAPGSGVESGEEQEEEEEEEEAGSGELQQTPGPGRRVELEDTLPDSTPLHLYEGEMLAGGTAGQNPLETEESTETAPESEISPEDEGWLGEREKPPTPTVPESSEEEAGMEGAPGAEGAEEEEGYFMVSAPSQEVASSEEAEISEDFEEIKVEATEASKEDLEAPGEASPVPEDEGHFEALLDEEDEDVKVPTEEPEMPKDEDEDEAEGSPAELEEGLAAPEADPGCRFPGGSEEPGSRAGHPRGSAVEELSATAELEGGAGRAELVGQEQEEEEEEEDELGTAHHDAAEPFPRAEPQDQAVPVSPPPDQAEQDEPVEEEEEEEAQIGDSHPPAGCQEHPGAHPPRAGSVLEQEGSPEAAEESPEAAELPADVMRASDILEIVEQALEFNQEMVMGARAAQGGQRDPGEDSSPASSSEEEPTVQEAPAGPGGAAEVAPRTPGTAGAENGLQRDASLEELAEFTEEVPNGIAGTLLEQEPAAHAPGGAPPALGDATPRGKHGGGDAGPTPAPLGDHVLLLAPEQPPACRLRAEPEPWASGDE